MRAVVGAMLVGEVASIADIVSAVNNNWTSADLCNVRAS